MFSVPSLHSRALLPPQKSGDVATAPVLLAVASVNGGGAVPPALSTRQLPTSTAAVTAAVAAAAAGFSGGALQQRRRRGRLTFAWPKQPLAGVLCSQSHQAATPSSPSTRALLAPLHATTFETASLEAGARLLEEAVRASQEGNPTSFRYQSREENRQSYVSQQSASLGGVNPDAVDEEGLPLVYSVERIERFWNDKPQELAARWSFFLGISTPFITRCFYSLLNGRLWQDEEDLARDAVDNLTRLGPTFVKLGQVLSIRPDVLPPITMRELSRMQDSIRPFSTDEARATVEAELGKPIEELFSQFSEQPIAAASLAQVYRATLRESGEEVAVKVQRPGALATISKDLYVLRRLADVTQPLIKRFTADETDYIALTETFAEGLYTELDFRNEALNALRMTELMHERASRDAVERLVIPRPLMEFTTRRVMLSHWVNGTKLTSLPAHEIQDLLTVGEELFLTQLLEIGFFHGDPHPGNLLKITDGPDEGKLCLLDFGLVAEVPQKDRDIIVAAVVHLGTQNWEGLIDDFMVLGFLSPETDRGQLVPILERVVGPYLKGGGAGAYKDANFQALTQDLLKINLEVPFSIPPYVSLLARSVATLEGIALQGDPEYQLVSQAYPFVVRKLLKNENRQSFAALRELLYDPKTRRLRPQRLSTMLQASLGIIAKTEKAGFIDFDTVPDESAPLEDVVRFLLSGSAMNLRPLLNAELTYGLDLAFRRTSQRIRANAAEALQPRLPFVGIRLPAPPAPPLLVPVPTAAAPPRAPLRLVPIDDALDAALPVLSSSEEVDLQTLTEAAGVGGVLNALSEGPSPQSFVELLRAPLLQSDDEGAAAPEMARAISQILVSDDEPGAREVLADGILRSVAEELLRTWRARLTVAFGDI